MKRSEVNRLMAEADESIRSFGFILPPFAYWTPGEMRARRADIDGIVNARLGWDITDYGTGDYEALGLFLFTVRNGLQEDLARGGGMCRVLALQLQACFSGIETRDLPKAAGVHL